MSSVRISSGLASCSLVEEVIDLIGHNCSFFLVTALLAASMRFASGYIVLKFADEKCINPKNKMFPDRNSCLTKS